MIFVRIQEYSGIKFTVFGGGNDSAVSMNLI